MGGGPGQHSLQGLFPTQIIPGTFQVISIGAERFEVTQNLVKRRSRSCQSPFGGEARCG